MYRAELIKETKELLKDVQVLKEDPVLDIEKEFELRSLSAALKKLLAADKELIIYRYFENKIYPEVAKLLFMDITTVGRKIDNIVLESGRKVYGMLF
jgi:DNA-directed RNA polymerase specialized sigma24 family protein